MSKHRVLANHASLDFVNTGMVNGAGGVSGVEVLEGFGHLLDWLQRNELAERRWLDEALARWGATPAADRVLGEARALRVHVRSVAEALAAGAPVPGIAVEAINALLRRPVRVEDLVRGEEGGLGPYRWRTTYTLAHPTDLLVPIAESAADLLTAIDPTRVGRCDSPTCGRLFLDTTKNRTRRWCDTTTCGNRTNVAAHRARQRATPAQPR